MNTPLDIFGVVGRAASLKLVAALYLPAGLTVAAGSTLAGGTVSGTTALTNGATAVYLGLTESPSGSGVYGGTADLAGTALPDSADRPYTVEVREVAGGTDLTSYAAIAAAFGASTAVAYARDVPPTLAGGWLSAGAWGMPGGGPAGLSGPSPVTLTFHDAGGSPVPMVDFTVLGQGSDRANSSGVATFGLPDGSYTVVARMTAGTVFANAALTVSGTTALTVTGTGVSITPPPGPGMTTGYVFLQDLDLTPLVGKTIDYRLEDAPDGVARAWGRSVRTSRPSGSDGKIEITLPMSASVVVRFGPAADWVTVPDTGTSSTLALPRMQSRRSEV